MARLHQRISESRLSRLLERWGTLLGLLLLVLTIWSSSSGEHAQIDRDARSALKVSNEVTPWILPSEFFELVQSSLSSG